MSKIGWIKPVGLVFILILVLIPISDASELVIIAGNDGYVTEGDNFPFLTTRNSTNADALANDHATALWAGYTMFTTTPNQTDYHSRGLVSFPTGTLPDNSIILSAKASFKGYTNYGLGGFSTNASSELIAVTVNDSGLFEIGDYSKMLIDTNGHYIPVATNITYENATSTGYNNFTITNLSYISKTGNTTFMLTHSADVYRYNLSDNWVSGEDLGYRYRSKTTATPPLFTITYTAEPTSSFTADYTGGISPLLVNFTDTTTGDPATAWAWYDNDTLFNSTQTPQFVAFTTGNHPIRLNASNAAGGTNSSITWINVTDAPEPVLPVPDFSADDTTVTWPTAVQFTDLSTSNILGRNWTFGDGTNSTAANPLHTYPNTDATYTVILEVVNISGYNTTTKADYITVTGVDTVANFIKSSLIGRVGKAITFTDASTITPSHWYWYYGVDETLSNTSQNVSVIFDTIGIKQVRLYANNSAGGSWHNESVDIRQGSTATTQNVTHQYTRPGLRTVTLTVCNLAGCNTTSQRVWVYLSRPQEFTPGVDQLLYYSCEDLTYSSSRVLSQIEATKVLENLIKTCIGGE